MKLFVNIIIYKLYKLIKIDIDRPGDVLISVRDSCKKQNELNMFKIMTKVTIIFMTLYIIVKLSSLIFVGETREILIIEAKQMIIKHMRNMICNEIITSDKYLTESKVISIATMQERNKEKNDITKAIKDVLDSAQNYNNALVKNIASLTEEEKNRKILGNVESENKRILEKRLMNYRPHYKEVKKMDEMINTLKKGKELKYMLNKFYIVDGTTSIDKKIFNVNSLLKVNNKLDKKRNDKPQIMIYHTHGSEKYIDSSNKVTDTVVGVGNYLEKILEDKYGYNVLHNTESYDVINKKWNRNAYDTALPRIKKILKDNPSIEVVIDLHRDSGREKTVTKIDGINVAKIMFFNGICRSKVGDRSEIPNINLKGNLGFSLDMQIMAMKMYPGFTKKIYLKGYRYNMHVKERYMLVEVGNNKNTIGEAKNAMIPFAKILNKVLTSN